MWWNRATPARRAASSMVWVPSTLVRKKRAGSKMARLLCDSAAKWTTVSMPWSTMRLGGCLEVADVALDEGAPVRHVVEVGQVAGVGEHVVGDDGVVGVLVHPVAHEVGADEPGAAGHEEVHGGPW